MKYKFSAGDKIRIIRENPWDTKRFPSYMAGKTGIIQQVRGRIIDPVDHPDRTALYSVMFYMNQISRRCSNNEKVFVDVFEDWILPE